MIVVESTSLNPKKKDLHLDVRNIMMNMLLTSFIKIYAIETVFKTWVKGIKSRGNFCRLKARETFNTQNLDLGDLFLIIQDLPFLENLPSEQKSPHLISLVSS